MIPAIIIQRLILIALVVASEEVANSFCKFLISLFILSVALLIVLHEVCMPLTVLVTASTFVSMDFIVGVVSSGHLQKRVDSIAQ